MIDKVRSDIEQNAGASARALPPCSSLQLRSVAVVIRFETQDAPKSSASHKLPDRLEVSVVTAILINGEQAAGILSQFHQLDSFMHSGCKRLVDDNIATRDQALPSKRIVCIVRRCNDHQLNAPAIEKLTESAHNAHVRILIGRLAATSLQNGG